MTEALLPPDPSKDGWYWWLRAPNGLAVPAQWRGYGWMVFRQPVAYGAQFMAEQGYRLASPHPIPGPEQLDALHTLKDELVRIGAEMADSVSAGTVLHGIVKRLGQRLSVVIEGKP